MMSLFFYRAVSSYDWKGRGNSMLTSGPNKHPFRRRKGLRSFFFRSWHRGGVCRSCGSGSGQLMALGTEMRPLLSRQLVL